jgi:hypothetical protein
MTQNLGSTTIWIMVYENTGLSQLKIFLSWQGDTQEQMAKDYKLEKNRILKQLRKLKLVPKETDKSTGAPAK